MRGGVSRGAKASPSFGALFDLLGYFSGRRFAISLLSHKFAIAVTSV
jgi:hypothetical protein